MPKPNAGDGNIEEKVDECMEIQKLLVELAEKGFTEIVLKNPETREERVLTIPKL